MNRVALIVNPFASEVTEERTRAVEQVLRRGAEVTTFVTERPGHAIELAGRAHGHFDAVVVYAGDGGFNEVLNGADGSIPLGFLPGGGTSVLSRALGLPRDPIEAARRVMEALGAARVRRISLGRVNGRRFGFAAGVGFDAELIREVDRLGRTHTGRRAGDFAFAWTAAKALARRRWRLEPTLEIAGRGRAALTLVANTDPYTYAGPVPLHVAPEARFELGLDLVAPVAVRPSSLPRLLGYALRGRGQERARDVLYAHDLDRIEVACDRPTPLQADGEDLGDVARATFESERDALGVLV